jgi:N-acetylneuraminate synthase
MDRPGPDIVCSMDPTALSNLIDGSKEIWSARGGEKTSVEAEVPTMAFAFASVVAIKDIEQGQTLSDKNIWVKRPGGGDFNAYDYESLLGKVARNKIVRGYQIKKSDLYLG